MKSSKIIMLLSSTLLLAGCSINDYFSVDNSSGSSSQYDTEKAEKKANFKNEVNKIAKSYSGHVVATSDYHIQTGSDVQSGISTAAYDIHGFKMKCYSTYSNSEIENYSYSTIDYVKSQALSIAVNNFNDNTVLSYNTIDIQPSQWEIYQMENYNPSKVNSGLLGCAGPLFMLNDKFDELYDHNNGENEYCFKECTYFAMQTVQLSQVKFKVIQEISATNYLISYHGHVDVGDGSYSDTDVTIEISHLNGIEDFDLPENPNP